MDYTENKEILMSNIYFLERSMKQAFKDLGILWFCFKRML